MARVLNIISTVMVVIVVALAVLLVGFRFVGFDTYIVLSGSMEPAYKTGSLIYTRDAEPEDVEVGDVITFQLADGQTRVTHRVVEIQGEGSSLQFITKGDNNDDIDASPVPANMLMGEVKFGIPKLGYIANYIQNPPGLYFAAGVGVILIVLMFLTDALIEEDKKTKKKNKKVSKTREGESKDESIE